MTEKSDLLLLVPLGIIVSLGILIMRWVFSGGSSDPQTEGSGGFLGRTRSWVKNRFWSDSERSKLMSGYWRLMARLIFFLVFDLVLVVLQYQLGWVVPEWAFALCRGGFVVAAVMSLLSAIIGQPPSIIFALAGVLLVIAVMEWTWQQSHVWLVAHLVS